MNGYEGTLPYPTIFYMNTRNLLRDFFFFFFPVADPYRYANYTHNHKNAIDTIDALHALIRAILPLMACANLH